MPVIRPKSVPPTVAECNECAATTVFDEEAWLDGDSGLEAGWSYGVFRRTVANPRLPAEEKAAVENAQKQAAAMIEQARQMPGAPELPNDQYPEVLEFNTAQIMDRWEPEEPEYIVQTVEVVHCPEHAGLPQARLDAEDWSDGIETEAPEE